MSATGWNNTLPELAGSFHDSHDYSVTQPLAYPINSTDGSFINTIGEMGGIGYVVPGHLYDSNEIYSPHIPAANVSAWFDNYAVLVQAMLLQINDPNYGLSGAVFTALADVGFDVTGLTTFDRLLKFNLSQFAAISAPLFASIAA